MLPPGEYKRGVGWTCHSDSAFCQITLVLICPSLGVGRKMWRDKANMGRAYTGRETELWRHWGMGNGQMWCTWRVHQRSVYYEVLWTHPARAWCWCTFWFQFRQCFSEQFRWDIIHMLLLSCGTRSRWSCNWPQHHSGNWLPLWVAETGRWRDHPHENDVCVITCHQPGCISDIKQTQSDLAGRRY